ncbi:extracellular solute-binding protein [Candidatus Phytoplasma solani]|uniref:extracellular solute-binding protein n=1 Tax=Candidatus Phytoplasma solani TaxID=69896 RepID=UPI0032DBEDBB
MILIVIFTGNVQAAKNQETSKQVLTLFNWGEFLDPQTIIDFEKETQIEVKQVFFSSNELAVTKIKSHFQYDLAILSEYAIDQLIQANLLENIEKNKLKTTDKYYNIYNDEYNNLTRTQNFDDYAVPYFWGKVVLVYNKKKVQEKEIKKQGFDILKKSGLRVALCNNSRDGLMLGLKAQSLSINKMTQTNLEKAKKWLLDLKNEKPDLAFINDQLIDRMSQKGREYYDVVVAYSGDANFLIEKNDNLDVISPEKGTNVWVDALIMPKGSQKNLAYQFINFLRNKDNYNKNLLYVKYDSPYENATNKIKIKDKDEVYQYDKDHQKLINTYWNDVIAYPNKKDYWLFIFSGLILISVIIIYFVNGGKRFS